MADLTNRRSLSLHTNCALNKLALILKGRQQVGILIKKASKSLVAQYLESRGRRRWSREMLCCMMSTQSNWWLSQPRLNLNLNLKLKPLLQSTPKPKKPRPASCVSLELLLRGFFIISIIALLRFSRITINAADSFKRRLCIADSTWPSSPNLRFLISPQSNRSASASASAPDATAPQSMTRHNDEPSPRPSFHRRPRRASSLSSSSSSSSRRRWSSEHIRPTAPHTSIISPRAAQSQSQSIQPFSRPAVGRAEPGKQVSGN